MSRNIYTVVITELLHHEEWDIVLWTCTPVKLCLKIKLTEVLVRFLVVLYCRPFPNNQM